MKEEKQIPGRKSLKIVLPVAVLIIAASVAFYMHSTAPKARRARPVREAPLVDILTVRHTTERVMIRAMGSVIPAREITLKSQVAGDVVKINPRFTEGGHLKTGEEILRIDERDYRLALAEKHSQFVNAEYALKLEMGRQDVAKREWELLNKGVPHNPLDSELALRKPHLEKAQADLEAARAALQKAELDLARTVVRAPFNCMVRTKNVDLGSRASSQDQLADLVGTDQYLVRASVPVDRLKWIAIPWGGKDQGSKTHIFYGNASGSERKGTVVRLLGDLEEEGRMARILIAVDDPLDLDSPDQTRPPLLIGEYVRVEIEGPELNDVVVLPRAALRDGTYVWVIGDGDTLDIRSVDIAWRGEEAVLVRNELRDGERIIMTGLSAPVQGMKVMVNTPTGETSASRPDKNRKQVTDKS